MNLCCNCVHKGICEWDISAYGKYYSFGIENCSDYRSGNEAEFVIKEIKADAFTYEQVYICSNCGKVKAHYPFMEDRFCWWCGSKMKGNGAL